MTGDPGADWRRLPYDGAPLPVARWSCEGRTWRERRWESWMELPRRKRKPWKAESDEKLAENDDFAHPIVVVSSCPKVLEYQAVSGMKRERVHQLGQKGRPEPDTTPVIPHD